MNDEPKSAAEMKEIRLHRKRTQEVEGIKAMADIAAADIAIRKRTEKLRALRLAKEAADRENPPEPKAKPKDRDAASKAVLDNMAKLKALRLAREAAAPPPPVTLKKARPKPKKPGEKGPALGDWLASQQSGGRRT